MATTRKTPPIPEGWQIDGKACGYENKQDFLKDICAFANGSGGALVLGMAEEKEAGRWNPIGIADVGKTRMRCRDWLTALEPPGVPDLSIEHVAHGGLDFLVIQVPRVRLRPACFQAPDGQCQYWVRHYDKNRPLTPREVFDAYASQYRRYDHRSLILDAMRRRFEGASSAARSVKVTMVVGNPTAEDLAFLRVRLFQGRFGATTNAQLSEPLLLNYDDDLARSFGKIPQMWICRSDDDRPLAIRLPGSTSHALFDCDIEGGANELKDLAHDAGVMFGGLLKTHQAFRQIQSNLGSLFVDPGHLWLLHIAQEAIRLPAENPLRCLVKSWLFSIDFDYESAFGEDLHAPLDHVVSREDIREAASRRLRFTFQGDVCLLSAVSLLGMSHSMFDA